MVPQRMAEQSEARSEKPYADSVAEIPQRPDRGAYGDAGGERKMATEPLAFNELQKRAFERLGYSRDRCRCLNTTKALRRVAVAFGVPEGDFLANRAPRGSRNVIRARWAAYAYFRWLGMKYHQIGGVMDRDHTTVSHGCRQADELLKVDDDFAERLAWIKLA